MGSWMQKFERKEDEKRERELNEILEQTIEEYYECNIAKQIDINKKIKKLENVIEAYISLRLEAFKYDENDFMQKQKELSNLRYELMQKNHNENKDSKSWKDYKKEEMER